MVIWILSGIMVPLALSIRASTLFATAIALVPFLLAIVQIHINKDIYYGVVIGKMLE